MIDDSKINKKFFVQVKKKVLKKKNSLVSGIQSFNDDAKSENNNLADVKIYLFNFIKQ